MAARSTHSELALPRPRARRQFWLWFNLLSLDAPAVAIAWQLLFSDSVHVSIRPAAVLALALAVWLIYAADRLLDVSRGRLMVMTRRHRFHAEHASKILAAALAVLIMLAAAVSVLRPALRRDGVVLSCFLALYFLLIHFLPRRLQTICPKELVVGLVFAAGTCLAPWSRVPHSGPLIAPAILFAILCCLNCAAIEAWEWTRFGCPLESQPHTLTLWLARRIRSIAFAVALTAAFFFFFLDTPLLFAALAMSAVGFAWLDKERYALSQEALRVLADVPLLSPLLLIVVR